MEKEQVILLNKNGYDPFIGFLKAYCILFVVVSHCLPSPLWNYIAFHVWGDMQVPMFILIQIFHAYKKGNAPIINYKRIFFRIILPFIVIQILLLGILIKRDSNDISNILLDSLASGGNGRGSYYFWVYLQFVFLLPFLYPYIQKFSGRVTFLILLSLTIGLEIFFSIINLPDSIYRLLCIRYLILIYFGLVWIKKGIVFNRATLLLSFISIIAVLFFVNTGFDLEPIFYNTGWKFHRWICYFHVVWLLPFLLNYVYKVCCKCRIIDICIQEIGRCSYEIYLFQMVVFFIINRNHFSIIQNEEFQTFLWMVTCIIGSVCGGIISKQLVLDKWKF